VRKSQKQEKKVKYFVSTSKLSILALPLFAADGCKEGGGGGSPSPSSDIGDWLSSTIMANLPVGTIDALHQVPIINWLV
jgi:hypothetical protein